MDPTNFLASVKGIPAGNSDLSAVNALGGDPQSMKRVINLDPMVNLRTSAGLVLTAGTVPSIAALETNALGVQSAANGTALGTLTFRVPEDYDPVSDFCSVHLDVVSGGTTNQPTISGTAYRSRPQINYPGGNQQAGAALTSALTVGTSAPINISTNHPLEVAVDLSGNGLQPNDCITVNLITGAHTTDAVNVYGLAVQIKSNFVFTDMAQRS
jgi:hypothetical protein